MVGVIGYCYGNGGAKSPRRILRPRRGPRSNDFRSCSRPRLPMTALLMAQTGRQRGCIQRRMRTSLIDRFRRRVTTRFHRPELLLTIRPNAREVSGQITSERPLRAMRHILRRVCVLVHGGTRCRVIPSSSSQKIATSKPHIVPMGMKAGSSQMRPEGYASRTHSSPNRRRACGMVTGTQQIFMMAGQNQLALLIVYCDFGRDFAPVTK
jgi:hypothetical protein